MSTSNPSNQDRQPAEQLHHDERLRTSSPNVATGDLGADRDLASLLRSAMPAAPPADVLTGVQQRIRERSGGKFYADRWSTERFSPISTYLVTSAIMLSIVLVTYFILRPLSGEPAPTPPPAPVRVIGSPRAAH